MAAQQDDSDFESTPPRSRRPARGRSLATPSQARLQRKEPPKRKRAAASTRSRRTPTPAAREEPIPTVPLSEVNRRVQEELRRLADAETYAVLDIADERAPDTGYRYDCPVCMENIVRARFNPCGHCVCIKCASRMWSGGSGRCPYCKCQIDGLSRVFMG